MLIHLFYRRPPVSVRLAIASLLLVAVQTASAAAAIDEIVVTADFRGRSAEAVPASVSVIDEAAIEEAAVQHFEELVFLVPNMNWSGDGHRARYFQLRGIGELEQYEGAPNPSVGFLIDDIDFSGIGSVATLFDLQRIEVLRGSQGSRYGANALAGLIYVQSREPGDEWDGHLQLTAGQDDAQSLGVAFGGPVADSVGIRVSAQRHRSNGFRHNSYLGRDDTHGRDEDSVRVKLNWQANEDWLINLAAMYVDINDGYDAFSIDNSLTMLSDKPGRDAQRSIGTALKATWSGAEEFELVSISSLADSAIRFSFDADWGNATAWDPYTYDFISSNWRERQTLSQEFRLVSSDAGRLFADSTDWLLGIYVSNLRDELTTLNQGSYYDPFWDYSLELDDAFGSKFTALTSALYGQLDTELSATQRISASVRIERRSSDYTDTAELALDPAETMFGGELAYHQELTSSAVGYLSLSRAYKAGGLNLGVLPEERRLFDAEYLWNLEAGIKARWLDDRLTFNAAIFYTQRKQQQVRNSFQLVPNDPASFVFLTDNAAEGRTTGLELEMGWRSSASFEWFASAGLLHAEFSDLQTPEVNLTGRDQAHAPNYTVALGGIYRHASGFFTRVDVSARDGYYFDVSHNEKSEASQIANIRIGYDAQRWSLQLWGRNVFDENYAVRGFYFGNEPPDFPDTLYTKRGDPRQFGVTFDARF